MGRTSSISVPPTAQNLRGSAGPDGSAGPGGSAGPDGSGGPGCSAGPGGFAGSDGSGGPLLTLVLADCSAHLR